MPGKPVSTAPKLLQPSLLLLQYSPTFNNKKKGNYTFNLILRSNYQFDSDFVTLLICPSFSKPKVHSDPLLLRAFDDVNKKKKAQNTTTTLAYLTSFSLNNGSHSTY